MDRDLTPEKVEGEVSLVIDYAAGKSPALDVLAAATRLIESLDGLDRVLLSTVDTSLEPVAILNDVQHSSLKLMLARALRNVPDEHLGSLDWKKWVGALLVKGKHLLLQHLDADAPVIARDLQTLEADYKFGPGGLLGFGFALPTVADVREAFGRSSEGAGASTWSSCNDTDRAR